MKVFNPRHFLRHISMPTLREFTEAHVLNANLDIDWKQPADTLPTALADAIDTLYASLPHIQLLEEREAIEHHIGLWFEDVRRAMRSF